MKNDDVAAEVARIRRAVGLTQDEFGERTGVSRRQVQRWEAADARPGKTTLEAIRRMTRGRESEGGGDADFRFIDLFAGIGGLRLGFEAAGGRCVFTSEKDKFCLRTYAENFGVDHPVVEDIRSIRTPADIPAHDVLLAGFPCQPFSLAGVSKKNALGRPHGFECETQGTLFFEIERILAHHRPKAFLLENVKHLLGHDRGRTYAVIMDRLERELGYRVFPRVIDARCVVPQRRERIFLVGFRDHDINFSWDDVELPAAGPTLRSVLHSENGSERAEAPYTLGDRADVNPKYTLTDGLWAYLQAYAEKHRRAGNGFGFGLVGPDDVARTLSARYYKDGSEILIRQEGRNPRRLTPRECARLMGFDNDDRTFGISVSDTQAYKQFGNAVVVPVVEAIAKTMASSLRREPQLSFERLLRTA